MPLRLDDLLSKTPVSGEDPTSRRAEAWLSVAFSMTLSSLHPGGSILSRCPGGPADVITHEQDGLLCEPESPESLGRELSRLIMDPQLASRLVARAAGTLERFRVDRVVAQYAALFEEAVHAA